MPRPGYIRNSIPIRKMSFPDYDGGSVEIGPSSPSNSGSQDASQDAEYVYVKYRIANKRLSSMEDDVIELKATISNYAMAIQNETQLREMYQLALLDEQMKHSQCRAAYLRLLQFQNSRSQCRDEETTAHERQTEHLLMNMREQHSEVLCVAADHIARTEKALERR
ncbi:hypothetical protein B0J14DRAFT_567663 [Halenospora varia]|nr:hypothetical protein B0J14DRAFT_567663 [Halenospora varia]